MKSNLGNLAIVIIAFAVGFFILNKENSSQYTMPKVAVTKEEVFGKVGNFAQNVLLAKAGDVLGVVSDKVGDLMEEAVDSVQEKTLKSLKETVDEKFKNLADGIGVDLSSGGSTQSIAALAPINFAIRSGIPAYFTIKNKESGVVTYEINWKDGKIEKGEINNGSVKTVSHVWSSSGEYLINFKIISGKGAREYDVSISIL